MFNNADQRKQERVQLVLSNGSVIDGILLLPMSTDVKRCLNGDSPVLEFQHADGRMSLVAKHAIVEIVMVTDAQVTQVAA
jgi:sRNA-binding regulator protein Hfq